MKKVIFIIRRIVVALCMLYTFNLIVSKIGVIIPINISTIILVSALGLPSILGMLVLHKIII